MKNLTLVIPAKNEEENLPIVLDELKKYNCKKLIVTNKISKQIIQISKKYSCNLVKQKRNGYGSALIEAIGLVKTKYLCIFNADGSFDPKSLKLMLSLTKKSDLVFASRYQKHGGSNDDTILTYVGNKFFTFIGNFFFNLKISDILYTYILGTTKAFKNLNLKSHDFRICVELPIKARKNLLRYKNIPSFERSRISGNKNVNEFVDGFLILKFLIKNLF